MNCDVNSDDVQMKLGILHLRAIEAVNDIAKLSPCTLNTGEIAKAASIVYTGLAFAFCILKEIDLMNESNQEAICKCACEGAQETLKDLLYSFAVVLDRCSNVNPISVISAWVISRLSQGEDDEGRQNAEAYVAIMLSRVG